MINTLRLKNTIVALFLLWFTVAHAQKLPNKQEASVRTPANLKIDGKATEWDNRFQVYNNATQIYYTLANDDEHLYLSVQATQSDIINKIMKGGVTLTLLKSKHDKNAISITYPVLEKTPGINVRRKKDKDTSARAMDSIMLKNNAALTQFCKLIKVTGVPALEDSLISIYNVDGVKAAGSFSNKKVYTFELSISLKQLGFPVTDLDKFSYHITLKGQRPVAKNQVNVTPKNKSKNNPQPADGDAVAEKASALRGISGADQQSAATDFWGEYVIAKK